MTNFSPSLLNIFDFILDGKPHGRGRMSSKLTGYVYEGHFVKYVSYSKYKVLHKYMTVTNFLGDQFKAVE
jgi:hypothetical protein